MKYLYVIAMGQRVELVAKGSWRHINRARKAVWDRNRDSNEKLLTSVYDDGGFRCSP
jgi:hypothetical protein